MSAAECRNELFVASRLRHLSSADRARLSAHLASCESCRIGLAMGRAFDDGAALELEDGLRIAKLGVAARRWAESRSSADVARPRPRRAARTLLLAACLCLVAAGASAGAHLWMRRAEKDAAPAPAAPKPRAAFSRPSSTITGVAPPKVTTAPPPSPSAAPASVFPPRTTARLPEAAVESAEVLFRRASAARRAGEVKLARTLYQRLQREHPSAPETKLSYLRLGSLLLERGDGAAALAQFDAHLRASNSALVPEALYGRGRSLALLGRLAEERATWAQLMSRFPSSPYSAHARRRATAADANEKNLR